MKSSVASIGVLAATVLLPLAACSPPPADTIQRKTSSDPQPDTPRPTPKPSRDPWEDARRPLPTGPVGDAQQFLLNAHAYQCASDGENLKTHQKSHGEARVVRNEAAVMEGIGPNGRNGIITDGKREFVFFQGRYEQEPGDAAAALVDLLKETSLQSLLDQSEEHTPFLGLEKIDGVEVEVYALTGRLDRGLPPIWAREGGHLRVWIARDNHRLLKTELKVNLSNQQSPGGVYSTIETTRYTYDPNVKVTLPGQ